MTNTELDEFKVTRIRPMAHVLNRGPLEGILARNVKFFGKVLSKVGENEFLQTL